MGSRVPDVVNAVVDALRADSALTTALGGTKVYTHVPQDTEAPYILTYGGREAPWAPEFNDDEGRQIDVVAECHSVYSGATEVDGIASDVLDVVLEDATYSGVTGYTAVQFVENAAPVRQYLEDGGLYSMRRVTARVFLS